MKAVTREYLRKVALAYNDAIRLGKPTGPTIAAEFDVTPVAARRLIYRAKNAGEITDTPKHRATTAVIFRGTASERKWTVCAECRLPWKCPLWRTGS